MTVLIRAGTPKKKNATSDRIPEEAVRATCGFLNPAGLIEPLQFPVSKLSKVSARALSVEAVVDLASEILWPEDGHEQPVEIDEFDAHRAQEYSLLAMLLRRSPDAATLNRIARLRGDATPLGLAHLALAQAAGTASAERIAREYFTLFIGIGRGELLAYGSYYLTGFLNERPLARLREDLRAHGIERAEGQVEPEDYAATLCRSWPGWPAVNSQRPLECSRNFSRNTLPRGLVVSSLIWSEPRRPNFIVRWGRSAGCSWRPRQKRSGFPLGQRS